MGHSRWSIDKYGHVKLVVLVVVDVLYIPVFVCHRKRFVVTPKSTVCMCVSVKSIEWCFFSWLRHCTLYFERSVVTFMLTTNQMCFSCLADTDVTATCGQDVVFRCQNTTASPITPMEWKKLVLSDYRLYFFRHQRCSDNY